MVSSKDPQIVGTFIAKLDGEFNVTYTYKDGPRLDTAGLQIIKIEGESVEFEKKDAAILILKSSLCRTKKKVTIQVRVNRDGFKSCKRGNERFGTPFSLVQSIT